MGFDRIQNYKTMELNNKIHYFTTSLDGIELPSRFTFPFQYTPHPLTKLAAKEVNTYINTRTDWHEELSHGKMFGVLIIQTPNKQIAFLAGFSGNLAGSNNHDYFVPPVYDLLQPGDFFRVEESNISAINHKVSEIGSSTMYKEAKETARLAHELGEEELKAAKDSMKNAKKLRDEERKSLAADSPRLQELIKESQFQKAEVKRLERRIQEYIATKDTALKIFDDEINRLKQERKMRSAALQIKLFQHFKMLNALGETKDLCQIFEEVRQSIPPAGAGECALPKLLQYAYMHQLKPLAFGEFWWGESPKDEIRHHGKFYPSCKGKCEPILKHMLIGLAIEPNPLASDIYRTTPLAIIYEDEWIVAIDKPAGMLSTPGKEAIDSISERLQKMYPTATGPLLVHRLDMATSGILVAAKTKEVHAQIQALFEARKVRKLYTALLDGTPLKKEGCINLPICPNPHDRPRQMVSFEHGKEAITYYKIVGEKGQNAIAEFNLVTGRTHQIRMHSAHPLGLNCPIKGDELYGKSADRLYLHATEVEFVHPITGKTILLKSEIPFL